MLLILKSFLSAAAGLLFIFAFYPYIKAIAKGQTSPRKSTWFVWAIGDIIVLAGMLANHTINGQIIGAVIGGMTTFLFSLKFGESGWSPRDKVCTAIAMLAIVLWKLLGDSNTGIAFSLLALAIAAWPSYVSAWHKPENEDRKAWLVFNISSLCAVIAIPHWTFADAATPIVFMTIDAPFIYLLFVRPALKTK